MVATVLIGVLLLVARALFSAVAVGEIKAWWISRLGQRAEKTSRTLPHTLRDDLVDEWLAELETLADRPLTALKFVRALDIAVAGLLPQEPNNGPERSTPRWSTIRPSWTTRLPPAWPVPVAAMLTLLGPSPTRQIATTVFLVGGVLFVMRVTVHWSLGYGSRRVAGHTLARATHVEILTGALWLVSVPIAMSNPAPALLLLVSLALWILTMVTSARTAMFAAEVGMPSGTQAIAQSRAVNRLLVSALHPPAAGIGGQRRLGPCDPRPSRATRLLWMLALVAVLLEVAGCFRPILATPTPDVRSGHSAGVVPSPPQVPQSK